MNQEFAVQSRLNVKQADNFYNPQFFMADGDEYLIIVPPIRYVRPLFFNADDTPGPMYGVQQNFLCLTEGNDYGFFNITPVDPLDTYNRSSKDGTFGVVYLPDEGLPKLTQSWPGARPFHPYILPVKPDGCLDLGLFAGEPDGSTHTGITLYGENKKPLGQHRRGGFLHQSAFFLGNTRKNAPLTWYKAGPGMICGENICWLTTTDLFNYGYILNLPFLYR